MRQGKKQKAKLAVRLLSYQKTISSDPSRASQMKKPGSNKKSH